MMEWEERKETTEKKLATLLRKKNSLCRRGLALCLCPRHSRRPVPVAPNSVVRGLSFLLVLLLLLLLLFLFVLAPRRSAPGYGNRVGPSLPPCLADARIEDLGPQSAVQTAEQRRLHVVEGALEAFELLGGVLRKVEV